MYDPTYIRTLIDRLNEAEAQEAELPMSKTEIMETLKALPGLKSFSENVAFDFGDNRMIIYHSDGIFEVVTPGSDTKEFDNVHEAIECLSPKDE